MQMSIQTKIARTLFPKEQPFMAKRKLRYTVAAILVGLTAAAALLGLMILGQGAGL